MTPRQLDLFSLLDGAGDVTIKALYEGYYKRDPLGVGHHTVRRMQQQLSWAIGALNARLWGDCRRIIPGISRGTYRLVTIKPR